MKKSSLVYFAEKIFPRSLFIGLRRRFALCEYNYHSAVKVRLGNGGGRGGELMATCKHCGALVEMDYTRQWRSVQVGLFAQKELGDSEVVSDCEHPNAIPLTAHETAPQLIDHSEFEAEELQGQSV